MNFTVLLQMSNFKTGQAVANHSKGRGRQCFKYYIKYSGYMRKIYFIIDTKKHTHISHTQRETQSSKIAVKTGIDEEAQSMTIRGKQKPPLASQSIAKAFWVILAHTYIQTQGYTHWQ